MFGHHPGRCFSLAIGSLTIAAASASAAIVNIPTSFGNGADAMIDGNGSHAATNYGSLAEVGFRFLDSGGTQRNERSYLRFELPNDIASINSATISLYKKDSNTIKTLEIHGMTNESLDNWDEGTITFNNAPAGTALTARQPDAADSDLLSSQAVNSGANTTVIINNSTNLVDFLASDTNGLVTFILSDFDNSFAYDYFASKEDAAVGAFAPTLNLDYNAVPEPAALGVFGLSVAGAAMCRRRSF